MQENVDELWLLFRGDHDRIPAHLHLIFDDGDVAIDRDGQDLGVGIEVNPEFFGCANDGEGNAVTLERRAPWRVGIVACGWQDRRW